MYYPYQKTDNELLETFQCVREKYKIKLQTGLIIKKANSIYPRLSETSERGKRGALEVIKNLCDGLIREPPFMIIFDIMKDMNIKFEEKYNCYSSTHKLTFLNLSETPPLNESVQKILNSIDEAKFNNSELVEIKKYINNIQR